MIVSSTGSNPRSKTVWRGQQKILRRSSAPFSIRNRQAGSFYERSHRIAFAFLALQLQGETLFWLTLG
jgi:hypothetical protein